MPGAAVAVVLVLVPVMFWCEYIAACCLYARELTSRVIADMREKSTVVVIIVTESLTKPLALLKTEFFAILPVEHRSSPLVVALVKLEVVHDELMGEVFFG